MGDDWPTELEAQLVWARTAPPEQAEAWLKAHLEAAVTAQEGMSSELDDLDPVEYQLFWAIQAACVATVERDQADRLRGLSLPEAAAKLDVEAAEAEEDSARYLAAAEAEKVNPWHQLDCFEKAERMNRYIRWLTMPPASAGPSLVSSLHHRVRSRGVARRPAVRRRRVPARGDPSGSDADLARTAALASLGVAAWG